MRSCLLLIGCLSVVSPAFSQAPVRVTPTPADFAIQLPLAVSGKNGVVQLSLPKLVYLHAQTVALADLRIFNSAGELLPFAFFDRYSLPRAVSQIQYRESPSSLFPVDGPALARAHGELQLEVKTASDGSLLAISARRQGSEPNAGLRALIVDLGPSAADEMLEGLQLRLPEAQTQYRATLAIDRSEDLKLWDAVAQSNIDWLTGNDGKRLINDRIEIPQSFGRYLRIRWLVGEPLAFAQVTARWRSAVAESLAADGFFEVRLPAQAGRVSGDYSYRASPAITATEVGLNLPDPNSVLPVAIGFYQELRGPKPSWRFEPSLQNTFYRLIRDGKERSSSRLAIVPLANPEWVVRAQTDAVSLQPPGPELVLRWKPDTLAFTARGDGFVLAFGAPPDKARLFTHGATQLERVAPGYRPEELSELESAQPGEPLIIPVGAILQRPAIAAALDKGPDQRKLVLWSVLILGVLVLAYMTWRLFKQLGTGGVERGK